MNKQQWHPAGTRQSGAVAGGWSAAIPVPTVEGGDSGVGLRNMVGSQGGGVERKTTIWGRKTTYCRSITSDGTVEVTTDCDDPELLLLAHKGDVGYWSGNNWVKDYRTRQAWTASIAARMLREGHAAADDDDGVWVVMSAASSPQQRRSFQSTGRVAPHALTGIVAQISGLRLLQTMALADGWDTTLGGFRLPMGPRCCWRGVSRTRSECTTCCRDRRGPTVCPGGRSRRRGTQQTARAATCSSAQTVICCGGRGPKPTTTGCRR